MIFSKDSAATSWVEGSAQTEFPLQNLPFGVFNRAGERPRAGVAIGDRVLDLACIHAAGLFNQTPIASHDVFDRSQLNDFLAMGRQVWRAVRRRIVALLAAEDVVTADGEHLRIDPRLYRDAGLRARALLAQSDVDLQVPCRIGNFVDFYSSREHATNVGSMFRDPRNPLLPNWLHLPVGYNGRSSSIVVSGTPIRRPRGQTKADDADVPTFGPTGSLDIELEMGFFTGPGNRLGTPIRAAEAPKHIFGMVLVNDWSARDIQKWEYVPLGPFLGKSFATSVSPWVVPLDALEPFRVAGPTQDPPALPYLRTDADWALDINLEVYLQDDPSSPPARIAATNFRHMYWSIVQQLVHLTSNGCNVVPGDLCASGTVSGPTPDSYGSLLELCWRGTKPLTLPSGGSRKFLADGDTVTLTGYCQADRFRLGFGGLTGTVLAAGE